MKMGRIGDGDVHAAYVEFRAKESDKVNSLSSFISEFLKSQHSSSLLHHHPHRRHHLLLLLLPERYI